VRGRRTLLLIASSGTGLFECVHDYERSDGICGGGGVRTPEHMALLPRQPVLRQPASHGGCITTALGWRCPNSPSHFYTN